MKLPTIEIYGQSADINVFLDKQIHEYNSYVTGITDGAALTGAARGESGNIIGAVSGHTWGGCCEIVWLWVHESWRRQGLGRALLDTAETEAMRRGCDKVFLATHSFQAPTFYERLGYRQVGAVEGYPKGHAKLFYAKQLVR